MEHEHKLLATAIDRFSNLPDEVAHHVLSFVDFKELVRVGSLSKRCRGLYFSTPSLKFYLWHSENKQEQSSLLNSLDRFLIHRGDNKIKHFCVHLNLISSLHDEIFRVFTWIHVAARCNVESVDLKLNIIKVERKTIELPSCIFLCKSLRSLFVDWYGILKVPSFTGSTNIQHLSLTSVSIEEGFFKWISSSWKFIKELQLDHVRTEKITIESSSLESFRFVFPFSDVRQLNISGEKLEDIHIEWGYTDPGTRSLNIFAPNLKYFKWIGNLLNHQKFSKFMCLEKAEILLRTKIGVDDEFDNAFEFLCSICRVKVLILSDVATKVLFKESFMPVPFDNISYLGMYVESLCDELVPVMVSLLRGMSNLNTLDIQTDHSFLFHKPKARGCNRKYWKSQILNFTDKLKEVTIQFSNGFNGMELARYILEQALHLEKMVIFYLPHQSYVIRKVQQSKRLSTAKVVFHERNLRSGSVVFKRFGWY